MAGLTPQERLMTPEEQWAAYHIPTVDGVTHIPRQIATLPLNEKALMAAVHKYPHAGFSVHKPYRVTEAFGRYSAKERRIHGIEDEHSAVDLAAPYGTELFAPVGGLGFFSYESAYLATPDGTALRKYKGKEVGYGLGLFGEIVTSDGQVFQLGHMSKIADHLPVFVPEPTDINGILIYKPQQELLLARQQGLNHSFVVEIKPGDPLGAIGTSGLKGGIYQELEFDADGRPKPIREEVGALSWDEPHVDLRSAVLNAQWFKEVHRDMYGKYGYHAGYYPTHSNRYKMGRQPLLMTDEFDRPKYA